MTITVNDIKLLKSQVLLDTPEGGGSITAKVVVDGESNNLFTDISELDRTYGNVSLRKAFLAILTANVDGYFGTNVIISKKPVDPLVNVCLFTTKDWFDTRDSAVDSIEKYLVAGTRWPGQLLGRQVSGQRSFTQLLRNASDVIPIGQTVVLVSNEGLSNEHSQFVRVSKVTTTSRTFTVVEGSSAVTFSAFVSICEISDPLLEDYLGPDPSRIDNYSAPAFVRDTTVADAAVYYGIEKLTTAANLGDLSVQADGIYAQLVPSAQSEIALLDLTAGGTSAAFVGSGTNVITFTTAAFVGPGTTLYLGNGAVPGTVVITLDSAGRTLTDLGGQIQESGTTVGTINYTAGIVTINNATGYTGNTTFSFKPAVAPSRVLDTAELAVTAANRGYTWIINLDPPPKPGATRASYLAQGKWYDLIDDGTGAMRGADNSYGVGNVNFSTGTINLTTGAIPDAGSSVVFFWGTSVNVIDLSTDTVTIGQAHTMAPPPAPPAGFSVYYSTNTV